MADSSPTVLLYFHANAEDLGCVSTTVQLFRRQFHVSTLVVEYPGYGMFNKAKSSEQGFYSAALVALRYLVAEVGVNYSHIIIVGRSIGSGPAIFLASRFPVGGLILVNAFLSLRLVAQRALGGMLTKMLLLMRSAIRT